MNCPGQPLFELKAAPVWGRQGGPPGLKRREAMQQAFFRRRDENEARPFWERRDFVLALVLLSALPLLWPDVPPLLDLPGHMGRYRVQLDLATSPDLQQYFGFHWQVIGNLGVDLLVELLAPLVGLETAVKLVVMAIPPLTVAGLIWVSYEVHGRIPPTALFAVPFASIFRSCSDS